MSSTEHHIVHPLNTPSPPCLGRHRYLSELDRDERHVDILALLVLAGHDDVKVLAVVGDLDLGHGAHQLAHLLAEALLMLGEDVVVQKALAAADAVCGQLSLRKPIQYL